MSSLSTRCCKTAWYCISRLRLNRARDFVIFLELWLPSLPSRANELCLQQPATRSHYIPSIRSKLCDDQVLQSHFVFPFIYFYQLGLDLSEIMHLFVLVFFFVGGMQVDRWLPVKMYVLFASAGFRQRPATHAPTQKNDIYLKLGARPLAPVYRRIDRLLAAGCDYLFVFARKPTVKTVTSAVGSSRLPFGRYLVLLKLCVHVFLFT